MFSNENKVVQSIWDTDICFCIRCENQIWL